MVLKKEDAAKPDCVCEGEDMDAWNGVPVVELPMKPKTKPIHEVRLGSIKAAIWKNETETGVRYNVTFCRLYKDGEQWKTTDRFGREDLLLLAKVADQAHSWVCVQNQDEDRTPNGTSHK